MLMPALNYAMIVAFNVFVACFFIAVVSLGFIYLFKLNELNDTMRHPLLAKQPFKRLPRSLQAGILQDYFLRLFFPTLKFGLFGYANRVLAHVDPKKVPLRLKWPLMGLWAGCWIGLIAMISLWTLMLLRR
ncbi:hypothetical protein ASB57_01215 [Bordetella sp. N]|nr:hypothetical protein ASB57_01215 [Bordetella sp. N]